MNAPDHLRTAAEVILRARVMDAATLIEAAGHFWSASFDEEHWPLALRVDSTSLKAKLMARGSIATTVPTYNQNTLRAVSRELLQFCQNAIPVLESQRRTAASL